MYDDEESGYHGRATDALFIETHAKFGTTTWTGPMWSHAIACPKKR